MKRILIALITILVLCTPLAMAQETVETADAGTTPDSPLYGLDKAFERISLALTFGNAAKAQKRLKIANERIAEIQAMTQKGKPEFVGELMKERDRNIDEAVQDIQAGEAEGKDMEQVKAHVREMQQKHIQVLQGVLEKVPEQAKQAIQRNIERAQQRTEAIGQRGLQAMGKPNETGKQAAQQAAEQRSQGEEYKEMAQKKGTEQKEQAQEMRETQTHAGDVGAGAQAQQQANTATQIGKN